MHGYAPLKDLHCSHYAVNVVWMPSIWLFWRVVRTYPSIGSALLISTTLNSFQFTSLPPAASHPYTLAPPLESCLVILFTLSSLTICYLLLVSVSYSLHGSLCSLLWTLPDASGFTMKSFLLIADQSCQQFLSCIPSRKRRKNLLAQMSHKHCFYSSCFLCCETPAPRILSMKPVSMCRFPVSETATCIC